MIKQRLVIMGVVSACLLMTVSFLHRVATAQGRESDRVGSKRSENPAPNRPIIYRRVYVPEDRIGELVGGYLPMKRAEFAKKIAVLEAGQDALPPGPCIANAEYRARLEGTSLVAGQAALEIVHAGKGASALSLDDCRLAISELTWKDSQPATLATTPDGKLLLLTDKSDRLSFSWSLHGSKSARGILRFTIDLPACSSNRLVLDLPSGITPHANRGLVRQLAPEDPLSVADFTSWRIELGGNTHVTLSLNPETADAGPTILLHEDLTWHFSLTGVRLTAALHLDLLGGEATRQLELRMPSSVRPISAFIGHQQLAIRTQSAADGQLKLVLQLPKPIRGVGHVLRLEALCPLKLGEVE